MALETQTVTVCFNQSATVSFQDTIQQYVAGLSGFLLTYGDGGTSFGVQTLTVGVKVTSVSGSAITVAPVLIMTDGAGHFVDGSSYAIITIMAYTGSCNNPNLMLINNTRNNPVSIPSTALAAIPVLTGFTLSYADNTGHYIQFFKGDIEMIQNCNSIAVSGQVSMFDNTNHYGNPAAISGGLIVNCDPGLNLSVSSVSGLLGNLCLQSPSAVFLTGFMFFQVDTSFNSLSASVSIDSDANTVNGQSICWWGNGANQQGTVDVAVCYFS
jgi:hypothetical protein